MTQKPSPGALKAAEKIVENIGRYSPRKEFQSSVDASAVGIFGDLLVTAEIATIIDRETGASDLLAALEEVAKVRRYAERIEEALRKAAKGERFPIEIKAILPQIFRKAEIAEAAIAQSRTADTGQERNLI